MGGRHPPVVPCHYQASSPGHLVTWSPGYLFASGHLGASGRVWSSVHLVIWSSASHLVIWSSGQLVVCRLSSVLSAVVFASRSCFTFAPFFLTFLVSLFTSRKSIPYCAPPLVVPVVSILTLPALILQSRAFFCRDYSLSSY